jgi:signal transduction histidine kinase
MSSALVTGNCVAAPPRPADDPAVAAEQLSLSRAFASFTQAAASLERAYVQLQGEVARLRHELEDTNRDLAASLEENHRMQQEHEALNRRQALAEMSALLAHEMRNPLGSLELFAGLLAESGLPPEQCAWVGHLQAGLRTLAATVNNVLHFHSQPTPALVATDFGLLLRSTHDFLRPLAQQAGVRMELDQELDGTEVPADRHRVEQVLLNLALNAFRFMPEEGVLTMRGRADVVAGRIIIELSDTGTGIAEANRERTFQPGYTTRTGARGWVWRYAAPSWRSMGGACAPKATGRGQCSGWSFPLMEKRTQKRSEKRNDQHGNERERSGSAASAGGG